MSDQEQPPSPEEKNPESILTGRERSLANLKPWTSENNPREGRKEGSLNFKTIIRTLLESKTSDYPAMNKLSKELGLPEGTNLLALMAMGQIISATKGKPESFRVIAEYFHERKLDQNQNIKGSIDVNLEAESNAKAEEFLKKNGWGLKELLTPDPPPADSSQHKE